MPDAEKRLWNHLRNRQLGGHKFRRQKPIGSYIVDFVCIEKKMIIEIDGGQHAIEQAKDEKRTEFLEENGYMVLRFWNNDVMRCTDAVLNKILSVLSGNVPPHPDPLPQGGEGDKECEPTKRGMGRQRT